ncbi:MAG: glycosyl transferase group 1 [Planctomycetaceae bacterium]|nr:glycosyl transferase group 1 [Planctomycetaceae bacterium]
MTTKTLIADSSATNSAGNSARNSAAEKAGVRRRVCHVSLGLCTGGMERLLVEFARCDDREHYELHFIALHNTGQPAEDIRSLGCTVHLLPDLRGKPWAQWLALVRCFKKLKPDVVHTHNAYPHFYGTLAARWCRIPAVLNTRHGRRIGTTWRARTWFWIAGMLADRVVAVSDDAAKLCLKDVSLPQRKVARIWNGIDLSRFAFRGPASDPIAISVARLSPEKDFPTLIRAVALAAEVVPELRLQIVGDGPEWSRLEQLILELGQSSRIQLLGERQDIPELLATAGFFATATLTEGISLTLLEAMASGLPVLATNVGGNPEIVEEDRTGYLVSEGNPEILAAALIRMVHGSGLWPELGRQGRKRVEQHFSNQNMVGSYEKLYTDLLQG